MRQIVLLLAWVCLPLQIAHAAGGASEGEARAYFDKATASFALGHYPVAAENFEKAFELKPDPALLYNAAQAHRLAGNKERALTLYQNYLRLYSKAVRRGEVETRVEELKKAIERDRQLATSPPTTTMPSTLPSSGPPLFDPTAPSIGLGVSGTSATSSSASSSSSSSSTAPSLSSSGAAATTSSKPAELPAAIDTTTAPVLVAQPGPVTGDRRPLTQKPLFWTAVGGAVAAVVVVVLIVVLGGAKDPSPSLGTVK